MEEDRLAARKAAGLQVETASLKDDIVAPTLAYVEHPGIISKSELSNKFKVDNVFSHIIIQLKDLSKFGQKEFADETARLKGREDCVFV